MTLYGTGRALLGRRRRFVDTFDSLLSRWQVVAGSLAVDAGALKAATLGNWGNNLVTNGSMETGDPPTGWTAQDDCVIDQAADERTGGSGSYSLDVTVAVAGKYAFQGIGVLPGASYATSGWVRMVAGAGNAVFGMEGVANFTGTSGTTWTAGASPYLITNPSGTTRYLSCKCTSAGGQGRFDDLSLYRRNAAAILSWSPAFRMRLAHISPASPSVVPAGWMFRYTDALNYWELRLLPNTAGNDLQIVQVTAGLGTVRAEADVDWTDGGTDEVELIVRGSTITTRYKKAGGVWTAGPSYASATQGAQSPWMGPLVYGTTTARWARVEVDW